jgi:hypothetical protein
MDNPSSNVQKAIKMNLKIFNAICSTPLRRLLAVLLALLPFSAIDANAPQRQYVKNINREFTTSANGMTAIYNKYGKIKINTWQKNSVKIDITILVEAGDQRSADKTFERIQVNFISTNGYIKAETMLLQDKSWWPSESPSQDFKINYDVWMPASNQLDLKNRYGNAYVSTLNAKLLAEIKHGDLFTDNISADVDLNLAYGKAVMSKVYNLSGTVNFGEVAVNECRDVQIDTKNSHFNIEKAGVVRLTSLSDNFNFGTLSDLRLHTKYSGLNLRNTKNLYVTAQFTSVNTGVVAGILDVDLTYGNLVVSSLSKHFTNANITAQHADVQVVTERGATYQFNAQGNSIGMAYPATATIRKRDEHGTLEIIQGYVGDANAKGMVKATVNYGDFSLK